jgi:hypothetical protein
MKKPHNQVVLDKCPLIERLFVVFVFSLGTTPAYYIIHLFWKFIALGLDKSGKNSIIEM